MLFEGKIKGKKTSVSYCDFCKENKPEAVLTVTGNNRWDTKYEKEGREVCCITCIKMMARM